MMKSSRTTIGAVAVGLFLFLSALAFPANVVVPAMELITHGTTTGGLFTLQTYGNMSLEVQGGYKFGGSIAFGLSDITNLENLGISPFTPIALDFLSAGISIRDVFSLPLAFTYFVGRNDTFGSGDGFSQFGVAPIMTRYRGFISFPTGPLYDGIYRVQGTGAHVEFTPKPESLSFDLYLYEDTHPAVISLGSYSADLRFLANSDTAKVEAFLGATYAASSPFGFYRGGMLFYASNKSVEFLAQIGIPKWDPSVYPSLNVNLFYLLVEPRLHLGIFSIVPTIFWHPGYYMQEANPTEEGSFDVNLNMYLGDLANTAFQGGLESNFQFQSAARVFQVKVSPWAGFSTPGVQWTVKLNAKLWPFSLGDMLDAFVGVRAEF